MISSHSSGESRSSTRKMSGALWICLKPGNEVSTSMCASRFIASSGLRGQRLARLRLSGVRSRRACACKPPNRAVGGVRCGSVQENAETPLTPARTISTRSVCTKPCASNILPDNHRGWVIERWFPRARRPPPVYHSGRAFAGTPSRRGRPGVLLGLKPLGSAG